MTDALGGTVSLTDTTGTIQTQYTFDPYGNTSQSGNNSTNSFAYTGRENDGIGLYYNRARYYSPELGRFISEDPLRFGSNFFSYASGNPIDFDDALGLATLYYWGARFNGPYLQRYGHVSLKLDDGTYISFYPTKFNLLGLNNPVDASFHEWLEQDDLGEGSSPDVSIQLNNLDEGAIEQWWQKFKKSNPKFQGLGRNCSTIVATALDMGGGLLHAPAAEHPKVCGISSRDGIQINS